MAGKIRITLRKHAYILALKDGPKTTHDMVLSLMVSGNSVAKAMKELRVLGMVESKTLPQSSRGRIYTHCLTRPYDELMKGVTFLPTVRTPIHDPDIQCVVELRNAGCTGQELYRKFREVRGNRTDGSIKNIVNKARRCKGWK